VMVVRCQLHKKSYHNDVLVYEVCSKFRTIPPLKAFGADTACFSEGTRSCTIESRFPRDTLRSETCLFSRFMTLLPCTSMLGTKSFAIESRSFGFTVSLKTCILLELMALIPSASVQVQVHVAVESHYFECEISFETSITSEDLVLLPCA
jgi:hypothetical protein